MRTVFIWALTALTAVNAQKISTSGSCGASAGGLTCKGSSFGNCCSQYGYCGSTKAYCGDKCQPGFGTCNAVASSSVRGATTLSTATRSSAAVPSSTGKVSTSARCGNTQGATDGFTCLGSKFGDCCSQYGYCGSTKAYCGDKCQAGFGKCNSISSSSVRSSTPAPSSSSTSASSSLASSTQSSSQSSATSSSTVGISSSSASSSTAISSSSASSSTPMSSSSASSTSMSSSSTSSSTSMSSSSASSSTPSPSSTSLLSSSTETPSPSSSVPSPSPTPDLCNFVQPMTWTTITTPNDNTMTQPPGSFTPQQCCRVCQSSAGCTYWYQFSDDDQCFIYTQNGAMGNGQCPLGVQTVAYVEGLPSWGPGQCGTAVR